MKCPADQNDLLEKQDDGFVYHECPACEGLWMRHRSLRTLVKKNNPNADIAIPSPEDAYSIGKPSEEYDTNKITICPVDGMKYYEHSMGTAKIDICPNCDGIWLDKGELDKIREELRGRSAQSLLLANLWNDFFAFARDIFSFQKRKP